MTKLDGAQDVINHTDMTSTTGAQIITAHVASNHLAQMRRKGNTSTEPIGSNVQHAFYIAQDQIA